MEETKETGNKRKANKEKRNKGNFNFWAAFFGIFYYIYKGLWKKGLLLTSLVVIILMIVELIFQRIAPSSLSTALSIGIFGSMANMDLQRKEQTGETMWKELPAIFHRNWAVLAITAIIFIVYMIIPVTPYAEIEDTSTELVTEILNEHYMIPLEAVDVEILDEIEGEENMYYANATLSDDSVVQIAIEYFPDGEYIEVFIPDQDILYLLR